MGWAAHPSVAWWCNGKCSISPCFSVPAWPLSRFSDISQSPWTWTHLRVTGDSKLLLKVNKCCPNRSRVRPCLSPGDCWDSVQHQASPRCGKKWLYTEISMATETNCSTFTRWDANSFIYIRVCTHLLAQCDITSAESFEMMITTATTALIVCNFLACAQSPKRIN